MIIKKLIETSLLMFSITVLTALPVFAEITDITIIENTTVNLEKDKEVGIKIADQDSRLFCEDNRIYGYCDSFTDFSHIIEASLNKTYKSCSYNDASDDDFCLYEKNNEGLYFIYTKDFYTLDMKQNTVDEWSEKTAKEITEDGMTKTEVLEKAYSYIYENYEYDYDITEITRQGAYSLITTGKGVNSSLTKAFIALTESVPFENEVVNWNSSNPYYLDLILAVSNDNVIAAYNLDGQLRYYDLAQAYGIGTDEDENEEDETETILIDGEEVKLIPLIDRDENALPGYELTAMELDISDYYFYF